MISKKDVVRMRVPFPNISSTLAISAHMYICLEEGHEKHFAKCQTYKPHHLLGNTEPFTYIVEEPDLARNPFQRKTIIDCDKKFGINDTTIPNKMRTTVRTDVCDHLFTELLAQIKVNNSPLHRLSTNEILSLNTDITAR